MALDENRREGAIAQINVTPLVDVMLVLLVIFMVRAPILQQGVSVDLPEVTASPFTESEEQLVVAVTRDGGVYLNDKPMEIKALREKLEAIVRLRPDRAVFLRADKTVPYGTVVDVMAAVRACGVRRLGMVTEPLGSAK